MKPSETPTHSPLLHSSFLSCINTKYTNNILLQVQEVIDEVI